jgi:hypothetical protein
MVVSMRRQGAAAERIFFLVVFVLNCNLGLRWRRCAAASYGDGGFEGFGSWSWLEAAAIACGGGRGFGGSGF